MPFKKVRVFANCDMTLIAWQIEKKILGCRGFALQRDISGAPGDAKSGFVNTYVGFEGGKHTTGEAEPSTKWPIQRFTWSDYAVSQGQKVRYRVIPMLGTAADLTQAADADCSAWSDWITVGTEQTKGFKAYFNRGIVGAQFLARQANDTKTFNAMLKTDIRTVNSKNRNFLSGPLRVELLGLLDQAKRDGVDIYAALYELNDPEIIDRLNALGKKCHLLLGSGAFKPGEPDENADVRAQLRKDNKIDLFDRLVSGQHFAHNKFIVFLDQAGNSASVWTGSTNCTVTGLCTQVNNGILITDSKIALAYKDRWNALRLAGNKYPPTLAQGGSTPCMEKVGDSPVAAWNVPCLGFADLNDAQRHIRAAKNGVLFLMFNPGTGGEDRATSLLQDIQALGQKGLYLHGVINQAQTPGKLDPSGDTATIEITDNNKLQPPAPALAITPHALTAATKNWFHRAFQFNMVMIHSKVVLVDPFGEKPVLMTGSHNMGPKASAMNDDNMVVIENAPGLAAEYAVNILGVYGHYKWLYNAWKAAKDAAPVVAKGAKKPPVPVVPKYDGNVDSDAWQDWQMRGANLQQIEFMMGAPITPASVAGSKPSSLAVTKRTPPTVAPRKLGKKTLVKQSGTKKLRSERTPARKRAPSKKAATAKVPSKNASAKKTLKKRAPAKKARAKRASRR